MLAGTYEITLDIGEVDGKKDMVSIVNCSAFDDIEIKYKKVNEVSFEVPEELVD